MTGEEQGPKGLGEIALPVELERDIQHSLQRFLAVRRDNREDYLKTKPEQFERRVSSRFASQRVYLEHQIEHSRERIRILRGLEGKPPPLPKGLSREALIEIFDSTTKDLEDYFSDKKNWGKIVQFPWTPVPLTAVFALSDMREHEAADEHNNRHLLDHFNIDAETSAFGK